MFMYNVNVTAKLPYNRKFSNGANFCVIRKSAKCTKIYYSTHFFKKQVIDVPSLYGPLSSSLSPTTIKDWHQHSSQAVCMQILVSLAAVKPCTYVKQPLPCKYINCVRHLKWNSKYPCRHDSLLPWPPPWTMNDPWLQVLLSIILLNIARVKWDVDLKTPCTSCAHAQEISKIWILNFILSEISNLCKNLDN